MLAKTRRLGTEGVKEVLARGRNHKGSALSAKILSTSAPFRCAVVISKKLAKTAVVRNRVRRAVYRALSQTSLPPSGHAILFVQSVPASHLTDVFHSELKKLLHV